MRSGTAECKQVSSRTECTISRSFPCRGPSSIIPLLSARPPRIAERERDRERDKERKEEGAKRSAGGGQEAVRLKHALPFCARDCNYHPVGISCFIFPARKKKTTIKKKDVADLSTRSCLHAEAKWNMAAGHYRHAAASYCEPKFDKP